MDEDAIEDWSEDPGWRLNWRVLALAFPYGRLLFRKRWSRGGDALLNLRSVYLSFPVSLALFGVVVAFVLPFRGDDKTWLWFLAIVVLTVVYWFVVPRMGRQLRCDSDATLAGGYRARMFLRIAFADQTAVFGLVAAFVTNSSWVYFACALLSAPALLRAAPTRGALAREQDELTARGCDRSLVSALRRCPPRSR